MKQRIAMTGVPDEASDLRDLLEGIFDESTTDNIVKIQRVLTKKADVFFRICIDAALNRSHPTWAEAIRKFITTMVKSENVALVNFWKTEPALLTVLEDAAICLLGHIEEINGGHHDDIGIKRYDKGDYKDDVLGISPGWAYEPTTGVLESGSASPGESFSFDDFFEQYPSTEGALRLLRDALCADYLHTSSTARNGTREKLLGTLETGEL